jgi:hypothetical protein
MAYRQIARPNMPRCWVMCVHIFAHNPVLKGVGEGGRSCSREELTLLQAFACASRLRFAAFPCRLSVDIRRGNAGGGLFNAPSNRGKRWEYFRVNLNSMIQNERK